MFGMTLVSDDAIADRLYRDNYKTIRQYVDILVSRGVDWGLIGPREIGRLWERHILNSIALESLPRSRRWKRSRIAGYSFSYPAT